MARSSENMKTSKKPVVFSESEIEVAKLLIQLSISNYNNSTCSNNKVDSDDDIEESSIDAATTTTIDDEDIGYGSKIRYIKDIYNATEPVPEIKAKRMKY
ncbi:hypothetical protein Lal_00021256 [Lupinus albus]|uniref:Uncharacterized protein n=1 Tax=Lupinus albus TaxID=3870 RepID=A0A6A5N0E5_LUPAL|nr:hypothetical protein Lalb_Chr07g0189251 [Lupinus albus]KAF1876542.1 hypothetical protein Lal_00021256 [Lupinus albus]